MSAPQLVLRFSSNYHMANLRNSGIVARYEIPVTDVRAIYYADTMLIVETIDGKYMKVTSREIEVAISPCIS